LAENRRAQPVARQALEEAVAVGAAATELATRYYQAVIHHALGELDDAMAALRALYPVLDGPMARNRMGWAGYPSCFIATFAGAALALQGGFEEGLEILEKGRALGEELDHPYSRTMVLEEYGFMQLLMGEPQRALETLERAMQLCVDNEVHVMHAPIAARLGRALIETGDGARGRQVIEDALERETYRAAAHYGIDYLLVAHAYAQLHDGELEGALACARRAEEEAARHDEQAYHVCGMLAHAEVLAHGDAEWQRRAFDQYAATLRRARELGMRPYEALVRQGMAALHARREEDEPARVEREAAIALWSELGAPARVEQLTRVQPTSRTARRSLH
jgi:tetratricopeptide (TPR) repeat protein